MDTELTVEDSPTEESDTELTVEDSPTEDSDTELIVEDSATEDLDTELSSSESSSDIDVDLEELYESFDYSDSSKASTGELPSSHFDARCRDGADEKALYSGAKLTVFQSYLLIFQYTVRHSLSTKAFTELLQLLSVHAPRGAAISKSVHNMKRYFLQVFPEANTVQHAYCSSCQRSLPSVASSCGGSACQGGHPAMYITVHKLRGRWKVIIYVYQSLDPAIWAELQRRFDRTPTADIRDVYRG